MQKIINSYWVDISFKMNTPYNTKFRYKKLKLWSSLGTVWPLRCFSGLSAEVLCFTLAVFPPSGLASIITNDMAVCIVFRYITRLRTYFQHIRLYVWLELLCTISDVCHLSKKIKSWLCCGAVFNISKPETMMHGLQVCESSDYEDWLWKF